MSTLGVMLVGILGHLSSVVIAGTSLLQKGSCSPTGMVTARDEFKDLGLAGPEDLVFGGWDIRSGEPADRAYQCLVDGLLVNARQFDLIADNLKAAGQYVYPGTYVNCGTAIKTLADQARCKCDMPLGDLIGTLRSDIRKFRARAAADTVVVINLGSTEPPLSPDEHHMSPESVMHCVESDRKDLVRASTLYSLAAIMENCPYVNFSPSNGALLPGIVRLAEDRRVPVMGNDGKTGETLVKSALSSMFRLRNLEVLSWEGFNILGNMDGKVLNDPDNKLSKIASKEALLPRILGYTPHSSVHIGYVPSLGDQKTAWDFIHFKGFLDTAMSLQFIWQGFDSVLAAPLVLDLIRLAELAKRRGESGLMPHLSSFFKAPLGIHEHRLQEQFRMLSDYVSGCVAGDTVDSSKDSASRQGPVG